MAKKRYEADYILNLNKTMTSLKNAKEQAEQFDEIMSSIGDRGNFNELMKYFLGLDNVIDELRQSTDELMSGLGDSLKGGYIASLDAVFGRLAELSKVSQNLFKNLGELDISDPEAAKKLEEYANTLNTVFESLGVKKININDLLSKPLDKQRKALVNFVKKLNSEINTSLGNINVGNIKDEFEDAFDDVNNEFKEQIDALEEQKNRYEEVINAINKKKIKIKTTEENDVEEVKKLIEAYKLAEAEVRRFENAKDTGGDAYKKALAEQVRLATLLKNTMDDVADNGSDQGSMFVGQQINVYDDAEQFLKKFYANSTEIAGQIKDLYKGLIADIDEEISKLNKPGFGGTGGGGVSGSGKIDLSELLGTLNDVSESLREIDQLTRELDEYSFDSPEYSELEERIESLKNSFIELYKVTEEDFYGIAGNGKKYNFFESLGVDDEDLPIQNIIEHFQKLILLKKGIGTIDAENGAGSGVGVDVVDPDKLKKDLSQIRELALQTGKELSFSISANGVDYVVESMEGMIKLSDEAATAVNSLNNGLTILAHSHPGGNGYFSVADIQSALNAKSVGVNSPIMAIGKNMASVLNLDGVTDEVLSQVRERLKSLSEDDTLTPQLFQEIRQIFASGGFDDVLNKFDISDNLDDLSNYLKTIGDKASDAVDPLEKFQSLIMYYSDKRVNQNNLSSFSNFWDDFTSGARSALEIFDDIMDKVGAVDRDGNPLKINTEGYQSLAVAAKNISVGDSGRQGGSGDGSGVDDEEIEKAKELRQIVQDIKQAVEDKTEAFKNEKEYVTENIPQEVQELNKLYEKIKDIENSLSNIVNLDINAIDLNSWINQLGDVLNSLEQIDSNFSNINSVLENLNTNFNDVVGNNAGANNQKQVDNMKSALSQLLTTTTEHNNKYIVGDRNRQELSAQLLSNGAFVMGYGENGSVPWRTAIEAVLSDLSRQLIMDVHSHPWGERLDGKVFSNDMFSGSRGDLSAWRTSKKFGAQLASMITGNFLHVFDISKLDKSTYDTFVERLKMTEQKYANDPKYSKYIEVDSDGNRFYKRQDTLSDYHEMTSVFKQIMLESLRKVGFSEVEIGDIYKEYNLKDDTQLTELATKLVELSNASANAVDPIDRLREILLTIGSNKIKTQAMSAAKEAYWGDSDKYEETKRLIRKYAGDKYDSELAHFDDVAARDGLDSQEVYDGLKKIISSFGKDIESRVGINALEGLRKGEVTAADVFNQFQSTYDHISQQTIDRLTKIDGANNESQEVQLLSRISSVLDSIGTQIGQIVINTNKNINDQLNSAAYNIAGLKHVDEDMYRWLDVVDRFGDAAPILDEHNVSEFKARETYSQADMVTDMFSNELRNALGRLRDFDEIDSNNIKQIFGLYSEAVSNVRDAYLQLSLYEGRYSDDNNRIVLSDIGTGQILSDSLQGMQNVLASQDTLSGLNELVAALNRSINTAVDGSVSSTFQDEDTNESYNDISRDLVANLNVSIDHLSDAIRSLIDRIGFDGENVVNRGYYQQQYPVDIQNQLNGVDIASETPQMHALITALNTVIDMVNDKTNAFKNEAQVVDVTVGQEIVALSKLEQYLITLKTLMQSLFDPAQTANITFDSWKSDLSAIETNVKNIRDYFVEIQNAVSGTNFNPPVPNANNSGGNNVPNANQHGDYALERTLQITNRILSATYNKIANGGNQDLIDAIDAATLELKNIAVNGVTAQPPSPGSGNSGNNNKKKTSINTSIQSQESKFTVLSNSANKYSNSGIVSNKLKEYTSALTNLRNVQNELNNSANLTQSQIAQKEQEFLIAKDACNKYASELQNLLKVSDNFNKKHTNVTAVNTNKFNLNDASGQESALKDYVNTVFYGKAKIEEFDESNQTLYYTLKNNDGTVTRMAASFDASMTQIGSSIAKVNKTTSGLRGIFDAILSKGRGLLTYATARLGVDELFQQLRNGVQYVKEIDTALTELKKVTDETDATYDRFLQNMSKTAGVVGSTVSELTTMAADWARLGYSIEDSAKLAESTAILLNVSEFNDATAASEALISTMQAFQYTADESQHVIDILNEVGNNYAVSSDGIATALQDSASALMEGGNNLEQAVALVAAANKVVQDPNSVGSALRTISLRLRGTSVEILEEMGEETDGVVESTSKLQEKLKALTGVDILTDTGAYKNTYTILKEIGNEWENISDIDKAATLELMAGKNRANTLSAILSNMKDLEGAYESAMKAEGSALRENEAYLDSIQGRIDLFTNAVQTFWMNLIDSDLVKGIVDAGIVLMKLLDTIHGKLLAIASAFVLYKRLGKDGVTFTKMFNSTIDAARNAAIAIKSVATATQTVTKAEVARALAAKGVNKALINQIVATSGLGATTGVLTKAQIQAAASTLTTKFRTDELTASQYIAAMSTMGLKAALQGLATVLKANPFYLVATAVTIGALAFDHFNTTAQEAADAAKEAFDEIQNVIESTTSTIQSLESELSAIQDKIDELDGKELSFADSEELKRLKAQREEIEHSLKVQEQLLSLQEQSRNNQAIASMKAYTKAASEGAEKTQKTWKNVLTTIGVVGGAIVGGVLTGGLGAVAIGGIAGGILGNKAGEAVGSYAAENEGTYDSWYDTYKKALDAAREDEQKALEEYQKDSSNIDKLDKWQEAQQRTTEIETEMYDHLSRMQQYYGDLKYGTDPEVDKELDAWYNFLDKFSIEQNAAGAKDTALDRIFGDNASNEIQLIEKQILDAVNAGEEFDFESAISGSEELKSVLDYLGISAEDVKNYFTQIGETAKNITNDIQPVKLYSVLVEDVDKYNEILSQTSEIIIDNTKVSQEYKDSLTGLGISQEELNECFDDSNPLIVKNAKALNSLVKSSSSNIRNNVKLAKSQARLQYYNLYKQMYQLSKGSGQLTGATLNQVNALYEQMNAIEETIAKYSMLEQQLLGAANAFTEFENAKSLDESTDYAGSAEAMVLALGEAFNTAELGSKTAQAAIAGLVPESVYEDLDTVDKKMEAIYDYFKTGKLSYYFDIKFDEDGAVESAEMKLGNLRKFIEDGLSKGVFAGDDWQHFDLSEDIKSLEDFATKMETTEAVAFAFFETLEDHDIEWLNGDYSSLFDKLIPDISTIQSIAKQMQDEFDQANVDLTVRPRVSWEKMHEAGWYTSEGSYSTVDTVSAYASEFGLSDKNGNDYAINLTPILPDGTVIKGGEDGLKQWVREQLASGKDIEDLDVFLGSYKTIDEASEKAQRLHELQEDYYAALKSYSLENDIHNNISALADLEYQLANGKIEAEEYTSTFNELYKKNQDLADFAREEANAWYEKTSQLEEYKNQLKDYYDQLESGKDSEGNVIDAKKVKKDIDEVIGHINGLTQELAVLNEPTEVTLQFAIDDIDRDLQKITKKIGDVIEGTHYKFNVEAGEYKVTLNKTDPNYKEVVDYVALLNEKHSLELQMGPETPTVIDKLGDIADILEQITAILAKKFDIKLDTTEATKTASSFKSIWDSIKSKSVVISSIFTETPASSSGSYGTKIRTTRVNGSAHASGDWGLPKAEHDSLVGELGQELVVDPHSGRYYTVGDRGAEFVDLPKDAIIFNHKQTEDLLSHGYVAGRGKAYAEGNAHVTIFDNGSSKSQWEGTGYSSGDDPTWDAAESLSNAADNVSDAADDAKDSIDFIEIKLEEIESKISKTMAKLELLKDDASQTNQKDTMYDQLVNAEKNKANTYLQAYDVYSQKADYLLSQIPKKYREMAKNGAIAIADFVGENETEIAEAINTYREMATKADDAETGYYESLQQQTAYRLEQIEDIADDFDNLVQIINAEATLLQSEMDLVSESGERLSERHYDRLIELKQQEINRKEAEKEQLQKELKAAVADGIIKYGTDEWYQAVDLITSIDDEIVQCKIDVKKFGNEMQNIKWDDLDKLIERFDVLDSELSHLYDRFTDDDKVVDDNGEWTNAGIAAIGVLAQQMETAKVKSQQYADAIDYLNKNWEKDGYSVDKYNEKLAELTEKQWESIESYEDAKDKIVDLNKTRVDAVKDGMQKELDKLKELIDKKKELLDADKEAHDFEKTVQEQRKNISDLERELRALSGDSSLSAAAQRKQIEAELLEARAKLEETFYDKSIEQQKDSLDDQYEHHEEHLNDEMDALDEYLKNTELVVSDAMDTVRDNAEIILQEIKDVSELYGIDISNHITQPWHNGANAVGVYKNSFEELSGSFVEELQKIIDKEKELRKLADGAAGSLIDTVGGTIDSTTSIGQGGGNKPSHSDTAIGGLPAAKPAQPTQPTTPQQEPQKEIKVNGKINAGSAKIYDYAGDTTGARQYYRNDPIYVVLQDKNGWLKVRHHKLSSGVTGYFRKSDVKAYAKGTIGTDSDQWAWIDEIGEELVLHAGSDGKLSYLTKGTSVIPADLTEKLMGLAVDPTQALEYSRPMISAPMITNNEIHIDMNVAEVVHIDTVTNDTMPDLTKAIEKQMDKYMKTLNSQIRKYSR